MADKRAAPRIPPFVAPCRVALGDRRFAGYLTDLSLRGGRVSCEEDPPVVGDPLVLEVRFRRTVAYSRLPCQVRWVRPQAGGGHVFGLAFQGSGADLHAVEAVLEEFQRRAAELT